MATQYPKKFGCVRERLIQFIRYDRQNHGISVEFPLNFRQPLREQPRSLGFGRLTFISDVISVDKDSLITEYEIKKSYSDFLNDFRKKKDKHDEVTAGRGTNRFYFVIPSWAEIHDKINKYLVENCFKNYGIIVVLDGVCLVSRAGRIIHRDKLDIDLGEGSSLASVARTAIQWEERYRKLLKSKGEN